MAEENRNDVLKTYTSDVHALVSHGVQAIHENKALMPVDVQDQTRVMVKNAWNRETSAGN